MQKTVKCVLEVGDTLRQIRFDSAFGALPILGFLGERLLPPTVPPSYAYAIKTQELVSDSRLGRCQVVITWIMDRSVDR